MEVFIDSDFKCHFFESTGFRKVETSIFDGKCKSYIEGHRYIPPGEMWTRSDGQEFTGEAAFPWRDTAILDAAQQKYEETSEELSWTQHELADADAALEMLGVEWGEEANE